MESRSGTGRSCGRSLSGGQWTSRARPGVPWVCHSYGGPQCVSLRAYSCLVLVLSPPTAASPPLVSLIFQLENGAGITGQFTGTLTRPNHIEGSVIFYGITETPQTARASYTRR